MLRRARDRSGLRVGSNAVGCCTMPGEQRGLGQRQVPGVGVEVALGRGLDAEGAAAEVGDVEVALEDLLLGVLLLDGHRVAQLAQLAGVRLGRRGLHRLGALLLVLDVRRRLEQHLLDVLLGQRRAALHVLAGLVVDEGPQGAPEVDAAVLVEPRVLDRDDRFAHHRGDLGDAGPRPGSPRRSWRSASRRRPGSGTARAAAGSPARPAASRTRRRCPGPPGPARRPPAG